MKVQLYNKRNFELCFDHPVTRQRIRIPAHSSITLDEPKSTVSILETLVVLGFSVSRDSEVKKEDAKEALKEEVLTVEAAGEPVIEDKPVVKPAKKKGRQPIKL